MKIEIRTEQAVFGAGCSGLWTSKQAKKKKSDICKFCKKTFCGKINLKKHIECVHEKLKNYTCDLCHRSFGRKAHLKRHSCKKLKNTKTENEIDYLKLPALS